VVNEAISDSAGVYLRSSPWLQICGEEFIAKAFEYAHAADPKAILFITTTMRSILKNAIRSINW